MGHQKQRYSANRPNHEPAFWPPHSEIPAIHHFRQSQEGGHASPNYQGWHKIFVVRHIGGPYGKEHRTKPENQGEHRKKMAPPGQKRFSIRQLTRRLFSTAIDCIRLQSLAIVRASHCPLFVHENPLPFRYFSLKLFPSTMPPARQLRRPKSRAKDAAGQTTTSFLRPRRRETRHTKARRLLSPPRKPLGHSPETVYSAQKTRQTPMQKSAIRVGDAPWSSASLDRNRPHSTAIDCHRPCQPMSALRPRNPLFSSIRPHSAQTLRASVSLCESAPAPQNCARYRASFS